MNKKFFNVSNRINIVSIVSKKISIFKKRMDLYLEPLLCRRIINPSMHVWINMNIRAAHNTRKLFTDHWIRQRVQKVSLHYRRRRSSLSWNYCLPTNTPRPFCEPWPWLGGCRIRVIEFGIFLLFSDKFYPACFHSWLFVTEVYEVLFWLHQ